MPGLTLEWDLTSNHPVVDQLGRCVLTRSGPISGITDCCGRHRVCHVGANTLDLGWGNPIQERRVVLFISDHALDVEGHLLSGDFVVTDEVFMGN